MACHLLHAIINMPLVKLKGKLNSVKKICKKIKNPYLTKESKIYKEPYNSIVKTQPSFSNKQKI